MTPVVHTLAHLNTPPTKEQHTMAFTTETLQTYRWRTAGLTHPADIADTVTAAETAYRQMYALDPTAPLDPAALDVATDGPEVVVSFTVPQTQTAA